MSLSSLPIELIYELAFELVTPDLNSLIQTSRHFCSILNPVLWDPRSLVDATTSDCLHARILERLGADTSSIFYQASKTGNVHTARKLLDEYDEDPDSKTIDSISVIAPALMAGHEDFVRLMVERGGLRNPNDKRMAIAIAIRTANAGIAKIILEGEGKLCDRKLQPCFLQAIRGNESEIMGLILEHASDSDGFILNPIAVDIAVSNESTSALGFLLDKGANISNVVLQSVVDNGPKVVLRWLISRDATAGVRKGFAADDALSLALEDALPEPLQWLHSDYSSESDDPDD
ncbi:hypothetical protein PAAG_03864 [Paracoccidioides lutzii Pb01]|uniref:F-box domain-containing protein n=1 Tax=Paracoccidioides lutzii (strain ATCC MYA-826 / Pb01) TaxID=502779 RepID=C1GZC0_PARBA|nr:hypothetical protein PAAG_03864 [Paracoccidioides lutzii Pb01]EEH41943.1 hypothetical protein PAAG_03864 [Paracoccidioides lutzii Pb01]